MCPFLLKETKAKILLVQKIILCLNLFVEKLYSISGLPVK